MKEHLLTAQDTEYIEGASVTFYMWWTCTVHQILHHVFVCCGVWIAYWVENLSGFVSLNVVWPLCVLVLYKLMNLRVFVVYWFTDCVAMNLELLLLSCVYDEDVWCVAVQKKTCIVPAKERKQRRKSTGPQSYNQNSWGQTCCGIQNFSDFRKLIRCLYQILYVMLRDIPSGVWG